MTQVSALGDFASTRRAGLPRVCTSRPAFPATLELTMTWPVFPARRGPIPCNAIESLQTSRTMRVMAEYSYLVLYMPRGTSRDAARRMLTDHAEYGHWELSKLRLYADGSRKATLRRQIIRPVRTSLTALQAGGLAGQRLARANAAAKNGLPPAGA